MTVGGRRRLGRRGEREKENLARELDTLAYQNESELDLPGTRGLSGFGLAVMRQSRPHQPPGFPTSASFSVARLAMSPIWPRRTPTYCRVHCQSDERNAQPTTGYCAAMRELTSPGRRTGRPRSCINERRCHVGSNIPTNYAPSSIQNIYPSSHQRVSAWLVSLSWRWAPSQS